MHIEKRQRTTNVAYIHFSDLSCKCKHDNFVYLYLSHTVIRELYINTDKHPVRDEK